MADLVALSELEAVNLMLESVGESPVNTLVDTGIADVTIAVQVLHNTSRNIQSRGYHFNTEYGYPLSLDGSNNIILPPNTLKVKSIDGRNLVQMGTKLYDKDNHTYTFSAPVKVEITLFMAFEDLPQPARSYIYVLASRDYQKKVLGSDTITSITAEDERMAKAAFDDFESDTADYSIFNSYDVARPILRGFNPVGKG